MGILCSHEASKRICVIKLIKVSSSRGMEPVKLVSIQRIDLKYLSGSVTIKSWTVETLLFIRIIL